MSSVRRFAATGNKAGRRSLRFLEPCPAIAARPLGRARRPACRSRCSCSRGALAGIAGIVYTARLGAADPNAGIGFELQAIAAVVVGGTSLMGGRGSVVGSFLGRAAPEGA